MDASYDPNFPPNLDIHPNDVHRRGLGLRKDADGQSAADDWEQEQSIRDYGIAGKVWDASFPILPYLTRPCPSSTLEFDPPCSLFTPCLDLTILELGSGQSLASLHLIEQLSLSPPELKGPPRVYLTDLPAVTDLCRRSVERVGVREMDVRIRDLAWGDEEAGRRILEETKSEGRALTHLLMIDLVYFPHLYPPLLRTLLQLTGSTADEHRPEEVPAKLTDEQRTEVILSYYAPDKTRSLNFEQPFFHALAAYFEMQRLFSRATLFSSKAASSGSAHDSGAVRSETPLSWSPHGTADDTIIYVCKRYPETLVPGWQLPSESDVMGGIGGRAAEKRGRGWEEELLGAIEWD